MDQVDFIPAVGGVHLGEGATHEKKSQIEVCYLQPGEEAEGHYPKEVGIYQLMKKFALSLQVAHRRQTTLERFHWKIIEGREKIDEHLRMGEQLERTRKVVSCLLNCLTFNDLNGNSFTSYLKGEEEANKTD